MLNEFLYFILTFKYEAIRSMSQEGSQKNLSASLIKEIEVPCPPINEQKKIAEILTSVDETMEATRKVIDQTKKVKKGLLQDLLTKGIGHTKFKETEFGSIPKEWKVAEFGSIVKADMPPVTMNNNSYYSPVIVKRRHNGVEIREIKKGKEILVKTQYKALPGTFLISKRQIIHGSCGIVPKDLENAIISKEYLALKPSDSKLNIKYLNYFSHTPFFQNTIVRTTYGVDNEKFVFKDKWWMKEMMPLPSKQEQNKIVNILSSVDDQIAASETELEQLQQLKKGLMQDLLTGKVRVV